MARPTPSNPTGEQTSPKMTKETLSKLDHAFSMDCTIEEACYYANIGTATYYRWVKEDDKLGERFARLKQKPVFTARQTVFRAIKKDPDLAFKYLERKRKPEFGADQPPALPPIRQVNIQFINAPNSTLIAGTGQPVNGPEHQGVTGVHEKLPEQEKGNTE